MNLTNLQNGSDIRGVALEGVKGENVNLSSDIACRIAYAFAEWLKNKLNKDKLTIAIGRDSRISGEMLSSSVIDGLLSSGNKVYNCGLSSTPSMFMTTIHPDVNTDGAIMITASHLPYNRNGFKFFTKNGGTDKTDIKEILQLAEEVNVEVKVKGQVEDLDFISIYSEGLVTQIRKKTNSEKPFEGSKIIVDAGNGAGGFFAEKVLKPLGANTEGSIYLDPDGYFPNHVPNPEDKEAMKAIQRAVLENKAHLGIIFDTDVDRAAVVDCNGKNINRNPLVALMSAIILDDHPNSTIVTDSVTSTGLNKFIKSIGGKHHRFKRGYKNVINESIRLNKDGIESHLAIETSGHCAIKENYFLDDGAYLVTKILIKFAELRKQNKTIGEILAELEEPEESKEIRVKIKTDDFKVYGARILEEFKEHINSIEGWSLETPNYEGVRINCLHEDGWCLIRMSLHDPVLPINIESNNSNGCKLIEQKILDFLSRYENLQF